MKVSFGVTYELAAKKPTTRAGELFGIFGMDPEQGSRTYVEPFSIDVKPGQVVLFSGVSGTGKTSCLMQFVEQAMGPYHVDDVTNIDVLQFSDTKTCIEQLDGPLEEAVKFASMAGLAEAQLFLRYPRELSDGQRYRFRIAAALAAGAKVLVADEFCATLDRVTAKTIAFNLRKLATRQDLILAVATTHTDIIEDLEPDHLVEFTMHGAKVRKKSRRPLPANGSRSTTSLPLREAVEATTGGLLTGTTAGTTSGSRTRRGD